MRTHYFVIGLVFGIPLCAVSYRERVTAIRQALARAQAVAGLKDEACAATVELDRSQWTKQRSLGGVLGRLIALPVEFWREFLPALGQIVGVPVVCESAEDRLERVVFRAMKAALHEEKDATCEESLAASS